MVNVYSHLIQVKITLHSVGASPNQEEVLGAKAKISQRRRNASSRCRINSPPSFQLVGRPDRPQTWQTHSHVSQLLTTKIKTSSNISIVSEFCVPGEP